MSLRIIELSDFTDYKFLTQNMDLEELQPCIDEAAEFDIQPVIGAQLFYDITKHLTDNKYVELINGKVYTPKGETAPVEFKGLKQVLKYYVYARLIVVDGVKHTNSGFVHKTLSNSEKVPSIQRTQMIAQARSAAAKFETDMIYFLNNHAAQYPLWKCGGTRKNKGTGFRINAI